MRVRGWVAAGLLCAVGCGDSGTGAGGADGPLAEGACKAPDAGPMRRTGMFLRLELFVDDLDAAVAFYRDGLGFIVSRRDPDYAVMSQGQVTLGLGLKSGVSVGHYFAPEITTERRGLGTEIVLEVDDVQAAYDAFVDAGYTAMGTPTERSWGLTDFRVADPDGYFVRITSR